MLIDEIRMASLLHKELGISYFQFLRGYFTKGRVVTIRIKNSSVKMDIYKAYYLAKILKNIEDHGWKIIDSANNLVVYENKQKGLKFYSRIDDILDFTSVINEVFVQELYKANVKNKVVIDVGAYRGESAIYFALQGAKKVIALEPDEENHKLALMNVKENRLEDRVVLLNKAVAAKEGVISLYRYSYPSDLGSTDPSNMPSETVKYLIDKDIF